MLWNYIQVCFLFFSLFLVSDLIFFLGTSDWVILHYLIHFCLAFYLYFLIRAHLAQPGYFQGEEITVHNFEENVAKGLVRENFCATCLVRFWFSFSERIFWRNVMLSFLFSCSHFYLFIIKLALEIKKIMII